MAFRNRTKRNLRKNRKSRKMKGGLFGIKAFKTDWDNRNNCARKYKNVNLDTNCSPEKLAAIDYHSDGTLSYKVNTSNFR